MSENHYTPPISHSMPIVPRVGALEARHNVNRFGLDLNSTPGHGGYVSPEVTPNTSHQQSHAIYGPSTPLQSITQTPFVSRSYHPRSSPYSLDRGSYGQLSYSPPGDADPYYYPPVLSSPPRGGSTKKKIAKKADGKQSTFLTKLYAILETPEYHHIIRWDDAGTLIVIEKPELLAQKILPLVYRQSRFASFSRQLNIYGWMRKMSLRHVEKGIVDPDASTWSHGFLCRDSSRDELVNFKRRVPPRPSQAARGTGPGPQRTEMSEMEYGSDSYSSPDAYHSHLFEEQYPHHPNPFWSHQQTLPQVQSFHALPPPVHSSPFLLTDRTRPAPISINNNNQAPAKSITGAAPQTAPLVSMIQTPVTRGHNRTRSYQCNSPLNPNPLFTDQPLGYRSSLSQSLDTTNSNDIAQAQAAKDNTKATYNPLDPSTWARRGFTDFEGNPMSMPHPSTQTQTQISSSVPNNFGSHQPASASAFQWTPSPPEQTFSAYSSGSSPSTPSLAGTVSPAIFQQGYTPPTTSSGLNGGHGNGADVPMPMPHSFTMGMNMNINNGMGMGLNFHQRQGSHPNPAIVSNDHHYDQSHTQSRHNAGHSRTLSLGEPISLVANDNGNGNNGSYEMNTDSRFPTTSTRLNQDMDLDRPLAPAPAGQKMKDDDTLPSAALRGFSHSKLPFEGMLPEHDEPMVLS